MLLKNVKKICLKKKEALQKKHNPSKKKLITSKTNKSEMRNSIFESNYVFTVHRVLISGDQEIAKILILATKCTSFVFQ